MSFYPPSIVSAVVVAAVWGLSLLLERRIGTRFRDVARMIRALLLPCFIALWVVESVFGYSRHDSEFKLVETVLGCSLVWFIAGALQALFLAEAHSGKVRARTPRLLVDIVRLCFVVIGMVMVYSGVWHKDVSPLLTTFGVGSLVVGLALQDTLGNLFAGLALIFERPVAVGDWIQLGDTIGRVGQITWRSVRIVTRELNEITIPNSAIGKDRIMNYSSPSRVHGFKVSVGFSYDAPPSLVKEMLRTTAQETPGVLATPAPDARTLDFAASSVTYELRMFIADYEQLTDVRNELMSRIWYAAKRSGIQIPYPITTIYKTEIPYQKPQQDDTARFLATVPSTELFKTLSQTEAKMLAQDAAILRFGRGEELLREGEVADFFYLVVDGTCSIHVSSAHGGAIAVTSVGPGEVVGEMAVLAGVPRAVTVQAASEVLAARIGKNALTNLLAERQDLLQAFAHYTAKRSKQIEEARLHDSQLVRTTEGDIDERALGERIRRFLGLASEQGGEK